MNTPARWILALLIGAAALGTAFFLMKTGVYGLTLFVVVPILAGGVGAFLLEPKSYGQAASRGALIMICLTTSLVLIKLEGLLCILMTLPLAAALGAVGGMLAFRLMPSRAHTGSVAMAMMVPIASLTFDVTAHPPVFEVRTAVEIAAPPEQVWKHVVSFSELDAPEEWFFRSGIAYPKKARIIGEGAGAVRYCDFSTGPFVEPIEVWDQPRLLKFRVTSNPAPLTEVSPYADLTPGHLHGYFNSRQGQFRLIPLAGGHTLLEGTTWYQHGLWPSQYWRWWSDAIIHRIHLRVLNHIRVLSE